MTTTDPVGIIEIMERLNVSRKLMDHWRTRGRDGQPFPEPRWTVGGRPAWRWGDVKRWHKATTTSLSRR